MEIFIANDTIARLNASANISENKNIGGNFGKGILIIESINVSTYHHYLIL